MITTSDENPWRPALVSASACAGGAVGAGTTLPGCDGWLAAVLLHIQRPAVGAGSDGHRGVPSGLAQLGQRARLCESDYHGQTPILPAGLALKVGDIRRRGTPLTWVGVHEDLAVDGDLDIAHWARNFRS